MQCVQLTPVVVLHLPEARLQAVVLSLKRSLLRVCRLRLQLLVSSTVLLAAVAVSKQNSKQHSIAAAEAIELKMQPWKGMLTNNARSH
jgi:hypothetical protein